MTPAFGKIHGLRRDLGLEEGDYRALLRRVTGKASLRDMSEDELGQVVADMRGKVPGSRSRLDGPYGPKLQALWISGWNLGVVRNREDSALLAFVKARTGMDHTRFLRDAAAARKAVEALKQWLERDGGVDFSEHGDAKDCVLAAQCRLLKLVPGDVGHAPGGNAGAKVALMQVLGKRIRDQKRNG